MLGQNAAKGRHPTGAETVDAISLAVLRTFNHELHLILHFRELNLRAAVNERWAPGARPGTLIKGGTCRVASCMAPRAVSVEEPDRDLGFLDGNTHLSGYGCEVNLPQSLFKRVLQEREPGFAFFGMQDELSQIIGRKVDLNTPNFLSRYFRDSVLKSAEVQYAQS